MKRVVSTALFVFAKASIAFGQSGSEPEALARASKFADQVVRVIPLHRDGSRAPEGFGLIVGESGDQLYIATPHHVVHGFDHPPTLTPEFRIVFRDRPFTLFRATQLDIASERDDLAVVRVDKEKGLLPPEATIASISQLPRGIWVWNIGISRSWNMSSRAGRLGPVDDVSGAFRVDALRTPPGASGGAGVTEFGIIGMVLEDANDYSLLLPVDRVVQLFKAWHLPVNLMTPLPPSAYPGADPSSLPEDTKPDDYCNDLKVIVKSASIEFSNISGKKLSDTKSRSKVSLDGWHGCSIVDSRPTADYFGCELGPFEIKEDAEKMVAEIGSDIKNSCLSHEWSSVESVKDEVIFRISRNDMLLTKGDSSYVRVDPDHPLIELGVHEWNGRYEIYLHVAAMATSFQ